jgi:3-hexulose-6-phosphate synthase / 6-phospho-3-hexuloisomerase
MEPVLQLALDYVDNNRALKAAKEASFGVDWLEAGTPLIKSEGLSSVRELRRLFPRHKIVADMKVMDTGRFEVEAAAKAGADIVTVLAVADDSTIKEAVDAAKNVGCEIMVDLIGSPDPDDRAKAVEDMGVDYVCVHLSIDQQMRGIDFFSELRKVARAVDIPVAAAGGLNSETVSLAVKAGASIIIVGGAITKAENSGAAAKAIKKAMKTGKAEKTRLYKKYVDPIKAFSMVSTANISDAMHRLPCMEGVKQVSGGKIVGIALTVRTYPGDWAKPVEAIDSAKEGDILVVDAGSGTTAVWGELASHSAIIKKVAGIVIDGAARDIEDIRKSSFPVYSRYVSPNAGEPKGFGEINVPIRCGGMMVRPGDYVIGDADGVIIVPKEKAVEVANRAVDILERENRLRDEIKKGSTLAKVTELRKWEKHEGCH